MMARSAHRKVLLGWGCEQGRSCAGLATTAKSRLEPRFWAFYNWLQLWPRLPGHPGLGCPGARALRSCYNCKIIPNTQILGLLQLAAVVARVI